MLKAGEGSVDNILNGWKTNIKKLQHIKLTTTFNNFEHILLVVGESNLRNIFAGESLNGGREVRDEFGDFRWHPVISQYDYLIYLRKRLGYLCGYLQSGQGHTTSVLILYIVDNKWFV